MNKLTILRENIVKNFFLCKRIGSKLCLGGFPSFRLTLSKLSLPLRMGGPEAPGGQSQGEWWPLSPSCPLSCPPLSPLLPSAWPSKVCTACRNLAASLLILHPSRLIPSP